MRSSVREESAQFPSAETVVRRLGVSVISDHTVVSTLSLLVRSDYWANVFHALAHGWHAFFLFILEIYHSLLSFAHELLMFFALVLCSKL